MFYTLVLFVVSLAAILRLEVQPKAQKLIWRPNQVQFNHLRASNVASFFAVDQMKIGMTQAWSGALSEMRGVHIDNNSLNRFVNLAFIKYLHVKTAVTKTIPDIVCWLPSHEPKTIPVIV